MNLTCQECKVQCIRRAIVLNFGQESHFEAPMKQVYPHQSWNVMMEMDPPNTGYYNYRISDGFPHAEEEITQMFSDHVVSTIIKTSCEANLIPAESRKHMTDLVHSDSQLRQWTISQNCCDGLDHLIASTFGGFLFSSTLTRRVGHRWQ
jgi:hypothetical protein